MNKYKCLIKIKIKRPVRFPFILMILTEIPTYVTPDMELFQMYTTTASARTIMR